VVKLGDLARLIRSKNAGPFELTFDIMFESRGTYEQVKKTGVINAQLFAGLYSTPIELVRIYEYDPAYAYKITIPRPIVSGSIGDSDVHGGQQFGPLVELDVPIESAAGDGRAAKTLAPAKT
jgi:hypothetical protein